MDDNMLKKLRVSRGYSKDLDKFAKFPSANEIRNFVSVVRQTLSALRNLKAEVDWDPILLGILVRKLDLYSSRSYQLERDQEHDPTVEDFLAYLDKRALALENTTEAAEGGKRQGAAIPAKNKVALATAAKTAMECLYCPPAA
ncbi:uncharacterized protein LOC124542490 [Vanessa cardui]|uniref:uncharacterized protein LOC124542490 n=1 Tax=Vanessa cardui TaxID=171605 RepID=UPI001F134540|nr:uncharacterized protein LOC124542490 [Vanessa cardui]